MKTPNQKYFINDKEVVNSIEKLCKVGDIYIVYSQGKMILQDLVNPYYIYFELQRISNDIKSDILYPNSYRQKKMLDIRLVTKEKILNKYR